MSLSLLVVSWKYVGGQVVPNESLSVCFDGVRNSQTVIIWKGDIPVDTVRVVDFVDSVRVNVPVREQNRMFEILNRTQKAGGSRVYY
jgi:hypothetical protein